MSSPLVERSKRYLADAARAFDRAPVEVAVVVFVAATSSYTIEAEGDPFPAWAQVMVASALVLAGAWTGTLLHALGSITLARRWLFTFMGVTAAVLYAVLVPYLEFEAEAWRSVLLLGAAVLWLAAMPLLGRPVATAVDRVRVIDGRIILRTIGALLYSAALYAGLALALAAVDNLFELELRSSIYGHVAAWVFCALAPWIVIGGLNEYVRPIGTESAVAGVVHRMSAFLVPPLLALYYVILYAYVIRIGVTREVPKNMLSPMVLAAGLLGALALFLFEPRPDQRASSRALRFTPPLFLPLVGLGIWAIIMRVDQYGWTEFRFVRLFALVVLGLLALGATIQLVRRQRFSLHIVPLALAATLLLAAIGPWSVLSLARRSQQARLAGALEAAGIAQDQRVVRDPPLVVPADVFDPINTTARYLAEHFGPDALPPLLAMYATDPAAVYELARRIGLERAREPTEQDRFLSGELASGIGVEAGDVTVYRIVVVPTRSPAGSGVGAVIDSTTLRVHIGAEVLHADLADVIGALGHEPGRPTPQLSPGHARVAVVDAAGRPRGTAVILSISGRIDDGALNAGRLDLLLLLDTVPASPPPR